MIGYRSAGIILLLCIRKGKVTVRNCVSICLYFWKSPLEVGDMWLALLLNGLLAPMTKDHGTQTSIFLFTFYSGFALSSFALLLLLIVFTLSCWYMGRAMRKRVFGHMRTAKAQFIGEPMPECDCAHALDESESVCILHMFEDTFSPGKAHMISATTGWTPYCCCFGPKYVNT